MDYRYMLEQLRAEHARVSAQIAEYEALSVKRRVAKCRLKGIGSSGKLLKISQSPGKKYRAGRREVVRIKEQRNTVGRVYRTSESCPE